MLNTSLESSINALSFGVLQLAVMNILVPVMTTFYKLPAVEVAKNGLSGPFHTAQFYQACTHITHNYLKNTVSN